MPAGRPTLYRPEMCEKAIELGKLGKSMAQIACELGITKETLYDWNKNIPEFSDALKLARLHSQNWWENAGQLGLYADKFQSAVYNRQMANRFPDDHAERSRLDVDNTHRGHDGGAIKTSIQIEFVRPEKPDVSSEN